MCGRPAEFGALIACGLSIVAFMAKCTIARVSIFRKRLSRKTAQPAFDEGTAVRTESADLDKNEAPGAGQDPAATYSPAGAAAPITDPGGTYSAAGASAPTTDPAGTYSSPYALNRLFLVWENITPDNTVLSFNSATAVANYYGATSAQASLANEFFAGYGGTSATMLFTRYILTGARPHLLGANVSNLTLNQLRSINGSLAINFQGYTYSGSINLSAVNGFSAVAT